MLKPSWSADSSFSLQLPLVVRPLIDTAGEAESVAGRAPIVVPTVYDVGAGVLSDERSLVRAPIE